MLAAAPLAVAHAADLPNSPRAYLQRMDLDHDGRISRDEYVVWMMRNFDLLDANHDGVLDGDELPPGARPVSRGERVKVLEARFARQDRNHDGFLDAHELTRPPS